MAANRLDPTTNISPERQSNRAIISIFSVVLVTLYGQVRILFAMGRDGLLPKVFTRVSPRSQTPVANTVIVLRRKHPELPRGFRTALFPALPILGIVLIIVIIAGLDWVTWVVFPVWMVIGLVIYFGYSRRNSRLSEVAKATTMPMPPTT